MNRLALAASVLSALLSSLCCILPVAFAVAEVGLVGASAVFAPLRPYLAGLSAVLLGIGVLSVRREACPGCGVFLGRGTRIAMWSAAVLVPMLASFPYWGQVATATILPKPGRMQASTPVPGIRRVLFRVEQLDCNSCATVALSQVSRTAGVVAASVSLREREVVVDLDPAAGSSEDVRRALEKVGFQAEVIE